MSNLFLPKDQKDLDILVGDNSVLDEQLVENEDTAYRLAQLYVVSVLLEKFKPNAGYDTSYKTNDYVFNLPDEDFMKSFESSWYSYDTSANRKDVAKWWAYWKDKPFGPDDIVVQDKGPLWHAANSLCKFNPSKLEKFRRWRYQP